MVKFEAARTIFFQWRFRRYRRRCCLSTLIGTSRSNDADGNENVKKKNWFNKEKQQLRTYITLFCTFFSCFWRTTTWKCLLLRFMENVNKLRRNFISLCELRHGPWPWNSPSGGFAYIWQSKWVGIIAIKTEGTQIHFLSDVLVAVRRWILKSNSWPARPQ